MCTSSDFSSSFAAECLDPNATEKHSVSSSGWAQDLLAPELVCQMLHDASVSAPPSPKATALLSSTWPCSLLTIQGVGGRGEERRGEEASRQMKADALSCLPAWGDQVSCPPGWASPAPDDVRSKFCLHHVGSVMAYLHMQIIWCCSHQMTTITLPCPVLRPLSPRCLSLGADIHTWHIKGTLVSCVK